MDERTIDKEKILIGFVIVAIIVAIVLLILPEKEEKSVTKTPEPTVITSPESNVTIKLYGENPYYVFKGKKYDEPGYEAFDNNQNVSYKIKKSGTVNTSVPGQYEITYEVDGITAKSLTYKDIEEKAILNYAQTHPNASGYVNNAGKPIWSEANIKTIFGLENTYGQGYILERTNSTTRRFLPAILANETFNKTTTDSTSMIYLQIMDMENDYANGSTYNPPTSASYWQGADSASPGTSRPMSFKQTYYTVDESPATYLDSIDRSLVFTGNNYWVASRSLRYTNSSSPYFQFYVRMVSNRNTLTQYVLSATNNQTGVTGSTIGTDGYGLRLRPIVTIDRSKFDFVDGGEDWNVVSH